MENVKKTTTDVSMKARLANV